MNTARNTARFWIDRNGGIVRLKLRKGQTVSHSFGGPTEEGYSWTAETYSFDGQTVTCEYGTDARDCDGRVTHSGECSCDVLALRAGYNDLECGVTFPAWQQGQSAQRDYSAEAAGY
jgi:hypothetical protein